MPTAHASLHFAAAALAEAEAQYRATHDLCGGDHLRTGHAWDRMRRAGDLVRSHVTAVPDGEPAGWRCFHCGDYFADPTAARLHFGGSEEQKPACLIKGAEGGLLRALRDAENQAALAMQAVHSEMTDVHRAFYAATSRHAQALIAAEEAGYEKGLKDAVKTMTAEMVRETTSATGGEA